MKFSRFVNYNSLFVILLTPFFLLPASGALAQGVPTGSSGITLSASSDNPIPGQTVTITAVSYSFNINSATVIWTVNGTQTQKGIGATTLDVPAPVLGKKTSVSVTAVTPDGSRYTNSMNIGSGSIDMIIESDGYTPAFFKGKMPLVFENKATVIAVPHLSSVSGVEYDPATLIYQWKKDDGTVLQDQSGYGKQSITMAGGIVPRPYYLIVTASTRDGSAQGQSLIQVVPSSPSILFYNNDPLYGPFFNRAITGQLHIGSQKETQAFASLFGFNFSKNIADALTLNWTINGIEHPELASSKSITLRAPDGVSGTSHIELEVRGVDNILQGSDNSFNASFEANSSTNSSEPINL